MTIKFFSEASFRVSVVDVTNMQSFMDKLNKMSISNINKHQHNSIDSFFRSVICGEDIFMGLYIF